MARGPKRPTMWVRTAIRAEWRREAGPELPSWVAAFQICVAGAHASGQTFRDGKLRLEIRLQRQNTSANASQHQHYVEAEFLSAGGKGEWGRGLKGWQD